MDKPVALHEVRSTPNPDVVSALEAWLKRAKAGTLRGVLLIGDHHPDDDEPVWAFRRAGMSIFQGASVCDQYSFEMRMEIAQDTVPSSDEDPGPEG